MTKEEKAHKATFVEKKTPFYKRAAFPWVIIYTVALIAAGTMLGWSMRSDFANEVRGEVRSQMVVVDSPSKTKQ